MADVQLVLDPVSQLVTTDDPSPTISVQWDRAVQQAVINTSPGPTIASRAYGIVHTAMFDAWAAYDLGAISTTALGDTLQRPTAENTDANKTEAMSFAAYRVLAELFPTEQAIFDTLMAQLGFDPNNTTVNTSTAAGIGNVSAETLMVQRRADGSNQLNSYADTTGYTPTNPDSDTIINPERWTPEYVPIDSAPGDPNFVRQQSFLTPHWGTVDTFGVSDIAAIRPVAPKPFFLADGTTVNPEFIAQTEFVVDASANLTDEQKLIAEFWEDGGGTSFPPGTWMTFGQFVSGRDDNSLDDDAVLFAALGNAVFDAGVATWEAKVFYDYVRPVRAVRELGRLGLIGDPITIGGQTAYAINAWAGPGLGTGIILAEDFLTYQTPGSDPSPPFGEYTSGHSSFSAAGAEILRLFTGSDAFGTSVTFQSGESRFEPGVTPGSITTLAWDTFTEAADEAGLSRIYGGIHFEDGDFNGRTLGRNVGGQVWNQLQSFLTGATTINLEFSVTQISTTLEIGVFVADDANGTIDGLAPGDAGYTAAALARSAVLFSPVSTETEFVSEFNFNSTRSFVSGSYLNFFSISNGTVDNLSLAHPLEIDANGGGTHLGGAN
ncbi:MAG: vanadium-dependent haloperoxidase, partial [Cyanobacteria bacterium J06642_11]